MKLLSKFEPQSLNELVGNEDKLEHFTECIENKEPLLLVGKPGIGKTSAIYAYANENDMRVLEVNASDERKKDTMKEIYNKVTSESILNTGMIVLFDEADGMRGSQLLKDIVKDSLYPVALTANDEYSVPSGVKRLVETISLYRPRKRESVEVIRRLEGAGYDVDFTKTSRDVRGSILGTLVGGESYEDINDFELVKRILKGKDFNPDMVTSDHLTWILDNLHRFYFGIKLYKAIKILQIVARHGDYSLLKNLPEGYGRKVKYPRYPRRVKALKNEG